MKIIKWLVIAMSFATFAGVAYDMLHANKHLIVKGDDVWWYLRYAVLFPGITICLYLLLSLRAAKRWGQILAATLLVLPALLLVHFVVSVMNAHTNLVYWVFQAIEILVTYVAWRITGKRWSDGSQSWSKT